MLEKCSVLTPILDTVKCLKIILIMCDLFVPVYDNQNGNEHYQSNFTEFETNGEYMAFGTVQADGGDRFGVSSICFDAHEELIWMGNEGVSAQQYCVCFYLIKYLLRVMSHPTMAMACKNTHPSKCTAQKR